MSYCFKYLYLLVVNLSVSFNFILCKYFTYVKVLVTQLCLTLCNPMNCRLLASSVHGILQVRILEWVAISSPGDLPDPGIEPASPALTDGFFIAEPPGKPSLCYSYTYLTGVNFLYILYMQEN